MIKRKPLVYIAGEARELPEDEGLEFNDKDYVHISGRETLTGKKTFAASPDTADIDNPADNSSLVPNTKWVQQAIVNAIATGKTKALTFKGVVSSNADLPLNHKQGWVYVVGTPGTYAGQVCEVWDTIVCVKEGSQASRNADFNADWWIVQANLNGAVISSTVPSVDKRIAIYDGTSGKSIKQSTLTIDELLEALDSIPTVDSALSSTSKNPVQNKVITNALNDKQDKLTFDTAPEDGSLNPVTSDGIYDALAPKLTGQAAANGTNSGANASKFPTVAIVASMIQSALNGGEESTGILGTFVAYYKYEAYSVTGSLPSGWTQSQRSEILNNGSSVIWKSNLGDNNSTDGHYLKFTFYNQKAVATSAAQYIDGGYKVQVTIPSGGTWLVLGSRASTTSSTYSENDEAGTITTFGGGSPEWLGGNWDSGYYSSSNDIPSGIFGQVVAGGTTLESPYGFNIVAFKVSSTNILED